MKRLATLLGQDSVLNAISQKADSLLSLQRAWQCVVPAEYLVFTTVLSISHKRLHVSVSNGAVAARLKLMLPSLLKGLKSQGLDLTAIRFQVQVDETSLKQEKPLRFVSSEAAKALGAMADSLSGTALGESLKRLSKRTHSD